MREWQSQSHVRWYCRYHVVWVPKYRKRAIFGEMRRGVGRIVRELCQRHGVELVEGHALSDHVHVLLGIPPKLSVANTVGFLKGKSAIRIHREYLGRPRNFTATTFGRAGTASAPSVWRKRSSAITSGSKKQTRRNRRNWNLANRRPLRGAFLIPPPQGAVADSRVHTTGMAQAVQSLHIGELAEQSGMTRDTLRYYERRGLLVKPPRASHADLEGADADAGRYGCGCRVYEGDGGNVGWPSVARVRQSLQRARRASG